MGIEPALLPRLFEPFMQADESLHRSQGGLGLGLALIKGLVELHGGTVQAHSEGLGCGAEFTVCLPLASPSEQAAPAVLARAARPAPRRETAHDGPAGVQKALSSRPDIVVCDIGLPGMSGYDVARAMRAEPSLAATLLVALTGYALPEDREQALRAGFDHHLSKPVSLEELHSVLASPARGAGSPKSK